MTATATHPKLFTEAFTSSGWVKAPNTFTVYSPSTGKAIAEVSDCTPEMGQQAIETALEAFASWRKTTAVERSKILRRWFDLLIAHQSELGALMALEMGKPVTEACGEVLYGAGFVEFYAEAIKHHTDDLIAPSFAHKRGMARTQPVGVVYAVTPWNFPLAMITRKVAPALAAGCVVINKPAELSPLTALFAAHLWQEAGGPAGTFQVLPTFDPVAFSAPFFADERVRKLTFTGSTEVGRILYGQSAKTLKRVSLELGGHAPFIVFGDADLDNAVTQAGIAKWRNCGQTCITANRFYVHSSVVEEFSSRLAAQAAALNVGDASSATTQVGPLVEAAGLEKVRAQVADALEKGATILTGGNALEGLFHQPTVLGNVKAGMRILTEETFGPVAPIISFDDEQAVIDAANDTPFGLAAYLFTRDLSRAFRVSEALEYGIVGVNDGGPFALSPQAPFGGVKASGMGSEGGRWGLEEYLTLKYVSFGLV